MQHFGNRQSVVFKSTIFYLNSNFDRSGCGYQHKIFIFCLFCKFMLFYFNARKRETQETYLWMMFSIPKFACNKQLIPSNTTSFNTSSYLTAECYSSRTNRIVETEDYQIPRCAFIWVVFLSILSIFSFRVKNWHNVRKANIFNIFY